MSSSSGRSRPKDARLGKGADADYDGRGNRRDLRSEERCIIFSTVVFVHLFIPRVDTVQYLLHCIDSSMYNTISLYGMIKRRKEGPNKGQTRAKQGSRHSRSGASMFEPRPGRGDFATGEPKTY